MLALVELIPLTNPSSLLPYRTLQTFTSLQLRSLRSALAMVEDEEEEFIQNRTLARRDSERGGTNTLSG
jgi:hypothetical protein